MMMFAYIDNVYYNKIDINEQRTIYWNRVIVSSIVVFSISLLVAGIIYNMRENRSEIVTEEKLLTIPENKPEIVTEKKLLTIPENKPEIVTKRIKNRNKRRTEAQILIDDTEYHYPPKKYPNLYSNNKKSEIFSF
jgi:hypothetical protein